MRGVLFALCLMSYSMAFAQNPGGPGGGGAGGGAGRTPPPIASPGKSNWWKKTEQKFFRLYGCASPVNWEDTKTDTQQPQEPLAMDVPWENNTFTADRRGYLKCAADDTSVRAVANSEAYDYWTFFSARSTMSSKAHLSRTVNWFWDGDANHPLSPTKFGANANLSMTIKCSGAIRPETQSMAKSLASLSHTVLIDRPFGWSYINHRFPVEGVAKNRDEQDLRSVSYVAGLLPTYRVIGVGAIWEYAPSDKDEADYGYLEEKSFTDANRAQCIVRAGFGYSYTANAEVSTTATSDGGTAYSTAEASIILSVDASPIPGEENIQP